MTLLADEALELAIRESRAERDRIEAAAEVQCSHLFRRLVLLFTSAAGSGVSTALRLLPPSSK
jgi:hypothetical protein